MENKLKVIDMGIDEIGTLGVNAISIVEQPAISVEFVALNEQKAFVQLASEEKMLLCGAILIPNQLIYRVDEETQEPYYIRYSKDVIEKVAYNYLKQGKQGNATYEHTTPLQGLTLVESWLVNGENDKSRSLGFDLPDGTWFGVIKCDNVEVWQSVKKGDVKGFSIEGYFAPITTQFLAKHKSVLDELEELLNGFSK